MGAHWSKRADSPHAQALPGVLAVSAAVAGLAFPRTEFLYGPAYIAAIGFAVATPLAFLLVAPKGPLKRSRAILWLFTATAVSAVASAAMGGLLLSMGFDGSAADIGGFPLWLLSTGALVTTSLVAVNVWRKEQEGPATTLKALQQQARRAKHQRN